MDMVTDMATDTVMDMEKTRSSGNGITIAVDFDGTIVEHKYPEIGKVRPFAFETLKALESEGYRLILWTSREGKRQEEAVEFCRKNGLTFYAVNSNTPPGYLFGDKTDKSKKIVADIYIDDHNLGGLPDWGEIYAMVTGTKEQMKSKKRPWWKKIFRRKSRSRR